MSASAELPHKDPTGPGCLVVDLFSADGARQSNASPSIRDPAVSSTAVRASISQTNVASSFKGDLFLLNYANISLC